MVFSLAWECDWVSWELEREREREVLVSVREIIMDWTSVANTNKIVGCITSTIIAENYSGTSK